MPPSRTAGACDRDSHAFDPIGLQSAGVSGGAQCGRGQEVQTAAIVTAENARDRMTIGLNGNLIRHRPPFEDADETDRQWGTPPMPRLRHVRTVATQPRGIARHATVVIRTGAQLLAVSYFES
jgi:hypothetical protein